MPKKIAYCGLDCETCDAYRLTQTNDQAGQVKLLERWRKEYRQPDMPFSAVVCDGCTPNGRNGGYCSECRVRACCLARGLPHCAACRDYICAMLADMFLMAPQMRENLERLRA